MNVISGPAGRAQGGGSEPRVRAARAGPLSPITVLVGASLQRPFLQRWLAAKLGAHANLRILMPGDLALLLDVRIDALSRGSVIHRIFERFYDEWKGKGRRRSPGRWRSGSVRSLARSATTRPIAVRPATRRCGRPTGSS